jgi:F-type H+-transporting ATPase subunit delta
MKRAARRYAKALFDLAASAGQRDRVGSDMTALHRLIQTSPDFAAFLAVPRARADQRLAVLDRAVGSVLHPLSWRFLRYLVRKRRLNLLGAIATAYAELSDGADGIVPVTLTTAYPLGPSETAVIAERFSARTGLRPRIQTKADPALIGGFTLAHRDQIYDFSVAGALQQLRRQFTSTAAEVGTVR